jgi:bifunctional UDP-N-acetylglucosamine pyrophosphorylase/glucosamine-1-phosphate N-acetyltransferase
MTAHEPATPVTRRTCLAIVLAAGEGTRMQSDLPKVLHQVAGRSMLAHVLQAVGAAGAHEIAVVIGPGRDDVAAEIGRESPGASVVIQRERLGTAHAVLVARDQIARGFDDVLIAFADNPLITGETFTRLRAPLAQGAVVAALGFEARDPTGYGRLVMEGDKLRAIREHKDASEAERAITLCNAGLMALDGGKALALLESIGNDNAQREFYLPDAVEIAVSAGFGVGVVLAPETEVMGVNDRLQLGRAEALMQDRLRERAMRSGATLIDPASVFLSHDTRLGRDVTIEPHVVFGPGVSVGDRSVIHAFSHIVGARIGADVSVGPYARLRPGADLADTVRIGNFVEIKNARLGPDVKVNHLSYVGDATVGEGTNIGAGTITCNYDGFRKHRTEIGRHAFIGSNSAIVAPVRIGDGAYVGTGSVVTQDVPDDALAIARGQQATKPGWASAFREKMKTDGKS